MIEAVMFWNAQRDSQRYAEFCTRMVRRYAPATPAIREALDNVPQEFIATHI